MSNSSDCGHPPDLYDFPIVADGVRSSVGKARVVAGRLLMSPGLGGCTGWRISCGGRQSRRRRMR